MTTPAQTEDQKGAAAPAQTGDKAQGAAAPAQKPGEEKMTQVPLAALQEEREKRQQIEAKLSQLTQLFEGQIAYDAAGNVIPRGQPAAPANPQQQEWSNVRQQLDLLWENDPRKAVQSELTLALQWYDGVNNSIEAEMDKVSEKYKDFQNFRGQVRNYLRMLPIDQRAKPGIVEAAYYLQKGQNFDSVLDRERKLMEERIKAGESVQGVGGGYSYTPASEGRRWTQDEVNVARMYGQTPEEYFGRK